jgi:hypothetical protein
MKFDTNIDKGDISVAILPRCSDNFSKAVQRIGQTAIVQQHEHRSRDT